MSPPLRPAPMTKLDLLLQQAEALARRALIGTREELRPLLRMIHADGKETVAGVPWRDASEKETTLALVGGGSKAKTNSRGGKSATSSGGGATKRKTRASATTGKAIAKSIHAATRGWLATRATAQAPTARMMKTARDRSRRQRCPRAFALIGEVARVGDGGSVGGLGRLRRRRRRSSATFLRPSLARRPAGVRSLR